MLALLAYLATAGFIPLITNDTYLHLTTGRLILEQASIPQSDAYSFTALGNRYVTHEWLAAVLYALAEKVGGPQAVVVAGKLVTRTPSSTWLRLRSELALVTTPTRQPSTRAV